MLVKAIHRTIHAPVETVDKLTANTSCTLTRTSALGAYGFARPTTANRNCAMIFNFD